MAGSFTLLLIIFGHLNMFAIYIMKKCIFGFKNYLSCTNISFLKCWNMVIHTNPYPSRGCWDNILSHRNCCGRVPSKNILKFKFNYQKQLMKVHNLVSFVNDCLVYQIPEKQQIIKLFWKICGCPKAPVLWLTSQ